MYSQPKQLTVLLAEIESADSSHFILGIVPSLGCALDKLELHPLWVTFAGAFHRHKAWNSSFLFFHYQGEHYRDSHVSVILSNVGCES